MKNQRVEKKTHLYFLHGAKQACLWKKRSLNGLFNKIHIAVTLLLNAVSIL